MTFKCSMQKKMESVSNEADTSKIKKMRKQDMFFDWMESCASGKYPDWLDNVVYLEQPMHGDGMMNAVGVFFMDEEIPSEKSAPVLDAAGKFAVKAFSSVPSFSKFNEYIELVPLCDDIANGCILVLKPKDDFWELDFDDAKYVYEKASKAVLQTALNKYTPKYIGRQINQ